ncbi:DUF4181 domain-containing protein [Planctomycetota bacterium]
MQDEFPELFDKNADACLPDDKIKKMHPMADWALSVGVLIVIVVSLFIVFTNKELAELIGKHLLSWKSGVIIVVIMVIIGTIRGIIHKKKVEEIRKGIQEKMNQDWGRK